VAGVEGLGDVGGAELDNDALLAFGGVALVLETDGLIGTEVLAVLQGQRDERLGQGTGLEEEGEEVALEGGCFDEGGTGPLRVSVLVSKIRQDKRRVSV